MAKIRFWVSFLLILIFSAVIYQFALDNKIYLSVDKIKRNYFELAAVVITALLGFIYFYKPRLNFLKTLWIFMYGASIFFLLVIAIIDNYIHPFSTIKHYRFAALKEFLISPFIFIIFYVLGIVSGKSKKTS
jgi:hypothetical protein